MVNVRGGKFAAFMTLTVAVLISAACTRQPPKLAKNERTQRLEGQRPAPQRMFVKSELARHPYMGWSSWSSMHRHVTAAKIEAAARVMAARLKKYGCTYINIDSGWSNGYYPNGKNHPNSFDRYGRHVERPPWRPAQRRLTQNGTAFDQNRNLYLSDKPGSIILQRCMDLKSF